MGLGQKSHGVRPSAGVPVLRHQLLLLKTKAKKRPIPFQPWVRRERHAGIDAPNALDGEALVPCFGVTPRGTTRDDSVFFLLKPDGPEYLRLVRDDV